MTFDTYAHAMLAFIDPKGTEEEWLTQMYRSEEFLRFAASKFETFNAKEFVVRLVPYSEFVVEFTGNKRLEEATRLVEEFWKEHTGLKFSFGDWQPGEPFPASHIADFKLYFYRPWIKERIRKQKQESRLRRGKK